MHSGRGVTLLELLMVLTVAAVLASAAVPGLSAFALNAHEPPTSMALSSLCNCPQRSNQAGPSGGAVQDGGRLDVRRFGYRL